MGQNRKTLPSATLALVLTLGERQELFPIFERDLLIYAAAAALRGLRDEVLRANNPAVAAAKKQEVVLLAQVLSKMIPELCTLLEPAEVQGVVVQ